MGVKQQSFWLGLVAGSVAIYTALKPRPSQELTSSKKPVPPVDPASITDPEVLLSMAQNEMREGQAKNRDRAVQAITQKNNLQALVDQTRRTIANLQDKADFARWKGDEVLAEQISAEQGQYQLALNQAETSLQSVVETTEQIKVAIRREEKRILAKTAEAQRLKAQWQYLQVFDGLDEALRGSTSNPLFDRAEAIIESARQEKVGRLAATLKQIAGTLHREAEKAALRGETEQADALRADLATLRTAAL